MLERNLRPASALFQRALELDCSESLEHPRPTEQRVVGTCRHFAVLATAFLRAVGVPARARCGFATYFIPPKQVDHWIVEYWSEEDRRWVRVDPEYIDRDTPGSCRPEDLRLGEFLDAGEAWQLVRSGKDDPMSYGVFGTQNWGPGEIRGNAMRDLASVAAKLEMLPWDEWGPMADSYDGTTGTDFDELIDDLAGCDRPFHSAGAAANLRAARSTCVLDPVTTRVADCPGHPTRRCTFPAVGGTLSTRNYRTVLRPHGVDDRRSSRSAPSGRSNRQLRVRGWRDLGPPTSLLPTTRLVGSHGPVRRAARRAGG